MSELYTCSACGKPLRFNVPRFGEAGGFVHKDGSLMCDNIAGLSTCCHYAARVDSGDEGTSCHVCTKCGKPCDISPIPAGQFSSGKVWCAMCGAWGDHGSGSCPQLHPVPPPEQQKAQARIDYISKLRAAVDEIMRREDLGSETSCGSGHNKERLHSTTNTMSSSGSLPDAATKITQELVPEREHADLKLKTSKDMMAHINKLTPDIKGKAFDPDWFVLREAIEQVYTIDAAMRQQRDWYVGAMQSAREERDKLADDLKLASEKPSLEGYRELGRQVADALDQRDELQRQLNLMRDNFIAHLEQCTGDHKDTCACTTCARLRLLKS